MEHKGCYKKMIQNASTDEFLEKVKEVAVQKDGSYTYMPKRCYAGAHVGEIMVCFPQVQ